MPLIDFYKHSKMLDGHLNKCKECTKNDTKAKYLQNKQNADYIKKERKRGRIKYRNLYSDKINPSNIERVKKYFEKYPEKYKVRNISSKIKNQDKSLEKHHWSYNLEDAKSIIWLNKKDHKKAHRFIIYDQERMMYRRIDNNILLDTYETHEKYIFNCILNEED